MYLVLQSYVSPVSPIIVNCLPSSSSPSSSFLLTLLAQYAEQGLWNCRTSVCPSVPFCAAATACGGFAAVGPAGRQNRSIAARRACSHTAVSRCEQCHVHSDVRSWTHLLIVVLFYELCWRDVFFPDWLCVEYIHPSLKLAHISSWQTSISSLWEVSFYIGFPTLEDSHWARLRFSERL